MALARALLGAAVLAVGIVDVVFGAFDPAHQPLQAWGDNVPGSHLFADVVGALLVAAGAALVLNRFVRFGAATVAAVYALFAVFWLPRFYTAPLVLGASPAVYIGVLGGVCQQLVVVCAAALVYASASPRSDTRSLTTAVRWIVGLSAIDFGLVHLTGVSANTPYVPRWMPLGQSFWVIVTGAAFAAGGVGMLLQRLDAVAARLIAAMLFVFSIVTLVPGLIASPHDEASWGGNAYEFVIVAAFWIVGERLEGAA
jgi:uncharacterized membrane protein